MDISLGVTSGGPTVVGSVLRSSQSYLELLSRKQTLECGIAFYCEQFPRLADGNQFREVLVESTEQAAASLSRVLRFFDEHNLVCSSWALAEGQQPESVEPVLTEAGYVREDNVVMALTAWPKGIPASDVRVLPARPMRKVFHEVCTQAADFHPAEEREVVVEAANERLDDHRIDAQVATVDKQAAGTCTLFHVGDVGRLVDLYVARTYRRCGVATALLHHLIAIARRVTMRVVCIKIPAGNAGAIEMLKTMDFVEAGRTVEFRHRDMPRPDYSNW